ncbi:MAG: ABC transporter permease [Chloracidobacterium sp.]|nr:ABC transporter permease [Chloracidobacterium sp.]
MLNKLRLRLRALFFKPKMEDDLQAELQFHLEREIEENIVRGMSPDEARYAALRSFGGVERVKEESRDLRGVRFMEEVWQDLRYGARILLRAPRFTMMAVLTLGLGIGAVTAFFSVADAVLIRPLPYRDAERLVEVFEVVPKYRADHMRISLADFYEWKNQSGSFEEMAAMENTFYRVTGVSAPEEIEGNLISANFFSFLGAQVALGRAFLPEDEKPDAEPVAVLSYQYWATRFVFSPNVIGQKITLNDKPHVIVGVLRDDFRETLESHPGRALIWTPAALTAREMSRHGAGGYVALARLKTGVRIEQARSEMAVIAERIARAYPASNRDVGAAVYSLHEEVTGGSRQTLLTLLAAVGLVLLIACANVSSLLLARGVERYREIAVRSAIGAGRWRIVRQLLTESALLALLGGAFGLLLARWMLAGVVPLIPRNTPRTNEIALDHRAMLFTLAIALLSSLLCGLAPALQTTKVNLSEALKDAARSASASRRSRLLRGSLVVWQIALTTVLLIGAGLLTNSLIRLYRTDPGLDTRNLLSMSISLPRAIGEDPQQWNNFWNPLAERARNLPGAQGVALVQPLPLAISTFGMPVGFPAGAAANPDQDITIGYNTVSHDYFRLMGVGLRQGRYFSEDDKAGAQPVVIVNESLARVYFPGKEVIGKTLIVDRGTKYEQAATIVGIVADSRATLDRKPTPSLYLSMEQIPVPSMYLVARTATDPAGYFGAMRNLVSSLDKNQPIAHLTTMDEVWKIYTVRPRFYLSLFGSLSSLALLLAAAGIYGTLSHTVSQRTHEIGVRRALGAQDSDVLRMVVRQGLILTTLGVGAGLGGALGLMRLMRGWLYEVSVTDPATFGTAATLLILIALCACYAPARRATKVDPMIALRCE